MVISAEGGSSQEFMEEMAFQKVKKVIQEEAGLNCSGYRDEYLKRRFEIRLRSTGANTYGKYIIYLKKNPQEFTNLLNDLTINYTMFFRDTDVYTYLEKVLLPKIFQLSNPTRIWSAGCASGEEPYSLSFLVHKVLGSGLASHPVSIYASDVDRDALATAAKGVYHVKQLNKLDSLSVSKFFVKEADEQFVRVKDCFKQIVHFDRFDLMGSPVRLNFDLILCRNVMIYFTKEGQQHIHMNFFRALKGGGYFITGKSELLSGEPAQKFLALDYRVRVYQKPLSVGGLSQLNSALPHCVS